MNPKSHNYACHRHSDFLKFQIMKKILLPLATMAAATDLACASHIFITPVSVSASTSGSDLWPASNLIQGPGTGFDAAEPHAKTLGASAGNWVTAAPGGFPSDYIAVAGAPVLTFDLGSDMNIGQIHTWGYDNGNTNGVSQFSLRFATDAEGAGGAGTSISYNPLFSMTRDDSVLQTAGFSEIVNARFVEFTALDNFFVDPGNVAPDAGGDRAGLGEVSFSAVPEPSTGLLGLLGLGLALRRRR